MKREGLAARPGKKPWTCDVQGLTAAGYWLGKGSGARFEVALATAASKPKVEALRKAWRDRHGGKPSPLLLVVLRGDRADAIGPSGDPVLATDVDADQVQRLAVAALDEPTHHAAATLVRRSLPEMAGAGTGGDGVITEGLLATHEVRERLPRRADWQERCAEGAAMLGASGRALIERLGFTIEGSGSLPLLRVDDTSPPIAVALLLHDDETHDAPLDRFNGLSPITEALTRAERAGVPYVVATRGPTIRLYAAKEGFGVGSKGPASTYFELNLLLLTEERAGYLPLVFGAGALRPGGTLEELVEESRLYAVDLGSRLRDRVYNDVVPHLAEAVARRQRGRRRKAPTDAELRSYYEQSLLILFRLLFVAYAEDRNLLPYRSNGAYQTRSLKRHAIELADRARAEGSLDLAFDPAATNLWEEVLVLWGAVDKGNDDLGVPQYNGGLFSSDPQVNPIGAALASLVLSNDEIGPALTSLLVDESPEGFGPVDFASLTVREFGTIYEGLLESNLAYAEVDLTVDKNDTYVPAKAGQPVAVAAGEIYLHDRSGARKSSGSYFTKPFAVEHLLRNALDPALDEHLERVAALLDSGDAAAAAEAFFDFRVVDLAMGSGHFLVAAVDHIETKMRGFLTDHNVPGVLSQLARLREAAVHALGESGSVDDIGDTELLRRQIARRCIYGVDLNPIAVELARLSLWIHTFVPGLPLSFLNHGLVCGNSLTGIGTLEEAEELLEGKLAAGAVRDMIAAARPALERLSVVTDATVDEVHEAEAAHREALAAVEPARRLLDLLILDRAKLASVNLLAVDRDVVDELHARPEVASTLNELGALHFPTAFPEVFLRPERVGFDVVVGNPPWEKLHIETHQWWGLHAPGIRSLPVGAMNREIKKLQRSRPDLVAEFEAELAANASLRAALLAGPFPDLGRSHVDLYKAFAWRFWQLAAIRGAIGVVLPRAALSSAGMAAWREKLLGAGEFVDVTTTTNTGGWVFDDAEHRYTIVFVSIRKTLTVADTVSFRGPFSSIAEYSAGLSESALELPVAGIKQWTSGAVFPQIPGPRAGEVFLKMRAHPRLDDPAQGFEFRPVQGDLNATTGKEHMLLEPESTRGLWPVFKGSSFNIWCPDTGDYYAYADPATVVGVLQERRLLSASREGSAFARFSMSYLSDPATLPANSARIAFRDVARATDTRTLIAALVPPQIVLTHKAPYLLRVRGSEHDEAFLLGVVSSLILDWYARRLVETSMSFELVRALPIPTGGPYRDDVAELAGRLAAVDDRFEPWALANHTPIGSIATMDERAELVAQLDATVARLYGLDEDDLRVIWDTFGGTAASPERLARVLEHFERLG